MKKQPSNKILYIVYIIVGIVVLLTILRLSSPEDDWICQDGKWVKHGMPASEPPNEFCYATKTINISGNKFNVEIADTAEKKDKGLSGRNYLKENNGMLFTYDSEGIYSFWMKEMLFPLDIIWISNGKIEEISKNINPSNFQPPNSLFPVNPVGEVLELNAGIVDKLNIKIGDEVK